MPSWSFSAWPLRWLWNMEFAAGSISRRGGMVGKVLVKPAPVSSAHPPVGNMISFLSVPVGAVWSPPAVLPTATPAHTECPASALVGPFLINLVAFKVFRDPNKAALSGLVLLSQPMLCKLPALSASAAYTGRTQPGHFNVVIVRHTFRLFHEPSSEIENAEKP